MSLNYNSLTRDEKRVISEAYFKHMISGICWVVGGALLTALTLSLGNGGGLIFWGAMVFGAVDFFRGLFGWIRYML